MYVYIAEKNKGLVVFCLFLSTAELSDNENEPRNKTRKIRQASN